MIYRRVVLHDAAMSGSPGWIRTINLPIRDQQVTGSAPVQVVKPFTAAPMVAIAISPRGNSAKNDDPSVGVPLDG